ncbi:vegetative cell wall protein gp1-like [Iris pallida]|uniref:Vegetative cell wall protein gp1-like n=1 Tax=Iris pallida TaxID=29817 RepID=A0AAX6FGE2_IRIPA|nr:vegetative cell wall protein gp1-like [Iris pallida]KAJ6842479.1 vegetative cell wall protein gp1-like [Iris pallida]KAJ6842480.1 vegetative cell wall protein gp1-like [Iris pallida]
MPELHLLLTAMAHHHSSGHGRRPTLPPPSPRSHPLLSSSNQATTTSPPSNCRPLLLTPIKPDQLRPRLPPPWPSTTEQSTTSSISPQSMESPPPSTTARTTTILPRVGPNTTVPRRQGRTPPPWQSPCPARPDARNSARRQRTAARVARARVRHFVAVIGQCTAVGAPPPWASSGDHPGSATLLSGATYRRFVRFERHPVVTRARLSPF